MKTFTTTDTSGHDLVHMVGSKDDYTITENGGAISYVSDSWQRTYVVSGNEELNFKRPDSQGKTKFKWNAEFAPFNVKASCKEWLDSGATTNGIYKIKPADIEFDAYCDMTTDGGGWTLVSNVPDNLVVTLESDYTDYSTNRMSFAKQFFNDTNPNSIMFRNDAVCADCGNGDLIKVERNSTNWGFTVSNYNNSTDQTGYFSTNGGSTWDNKGSVKYASHAGWESATFSFTLGGLNNGYSGNSDLRFILGPTHIEGTASSYVWHNFWGNSVSIANTWSTGGAGRVYMR